MTVMKYQERFLSGVSFEGASDGNIGGAKPGEGDILGISKVTVYGTRQVLGGKFLGTTLIAAYRCKPGGVEVSVMVLLG